MGETPCADRGCNGPAKQRLRGPKASWLANGAPAVSLRLPTRHRVLPPAPRVAQPSSHHQRPLGVQRRRRSRLRAGLLLMLPWTSEHPKSHFFSSGHTWDGVLPTGITRLSAGSFIYIRGQPSYPRAGDNLLLLCSLGPKASRLYTLDS